MAMTGAERVRRHRALRKRVTISQGEILATGLMAIRSKNGKISFYRWQDDKLVRFDAETIP